MRAVLARRGVCSRAHTRGLRLSAIYRRPASGDRLLRCVDSRNRLKFNHLLNEQFRPIVALPRCSSQQPRRAISLTGAQAMTRIFRVLIAAASVAAITFNMAHAQAAPATVTFNDPNCASWGVSQSGSNFTLTCQTLLCTISADKPAPLPTDDVVLTAQLRRLLRQRVHVEQVQRPRELSRYFVDDDDGQPRQLGARQCASSAASTRSRQPMRRTARVPRISR